MLKTLRAKLLAFCLIITIIPLFIVGVLSYEWQKQALTDREEERLFAYAEALAADVESMIEERLEGVDYLARNPILVDSESTKAEIDQQIEQFTDSHKAYDDVVVIDDSGVVVSDIDLNITGEKVIKRSWFENSVSGQTNISDLYRSPTTGEPSLVISAPIYNQDQEIKRVVSPVFNLSVFYEKLNRFARERASAHASGESFLLNEGGELIAHPEEERILKENQMRRLGLSRQHIEEHGDNEELYLYAENNEVYAFKEVKQVDGFPHNWYIGVSADRSKLYQPLDSLLFQYVLIFGLVLLLASFFTVRLSHYIVRPVKQLVETTSKFAKGERLQPKYVQAYEEINKLNQTFDAMTKRLHDREKTHRKSTLIIETTDNGVFAFDRNKGEVTLFNQTCEHVFQILKDEMIGSKVDDICPSSHPFHLFIEQLKLHEVLNDETKQFEVRCSIEGDERTFLTSVSTLPSIDGDPDDWEVLVIFNEVTEKRLMQEELLRSEKLSAVGQISAGLAHEIRNPITIIRGFIQLFDQKASSEEEKRYYSLILKEIDRVNQIINDLLNLASPTSNVEKVKVNIPNKLDDLLMLYSSTFQNQHIKLETKYSSNGAYVWANESQVQQVFVNIVQNAIEAMDDGGTLTVEAFEDKQANMLTVSFTDTGGGMDEKTLKNLGTPFHTTKPNGTGLGLVMSYRMIEDIGGKMKVNSQLNEGTTFKIQLPIVQNG
ncbi:PAS domain-containing sensor histidine kinase [Texcoconibacillus texcoconensis]|uniref:histidine kinase n=1 Tax=Texcoconibacillus texcoconensis TaxID=1095777 RepID=A0A840QS21_9BACI|nr:PAS domain-containing sensor histidine kinase [Texcoconibacillus texcoconensis]MBB5174140.1 signal transduction histidine kinase [Texcoconibacillus texcoconensis]